MVFRSMFDFEQLAEFELRVRGLAPAWYTTRDYLFWRIAKPRADAMAQDGSSRWDGFSSNCKPRYNG